VQNEQGTRWSGVQSSWHSFASPHAVHAPHFVPLRPLRLLAPHHLHTTTLQHAGASAFPIFALSHPFSFRAPRTCCNQLPRPLQGFLEVLGVCVLCSHVSSRVAACEMRSGEEGRRGAWGARAEGRGGCGRAEKAKARATLAMLARGARGVARAVARVSRTAGAWGGEGARGHAGRAVSARVSRSTWDEEGRAWWGAAPWIASVAAGVAWGTSGLEGSSPAAGEDTDRRFQRRGPLMIIAGTASHALAEGIGACRRGRWGRGGEGWTGAEGFCVWGEVRSCAAGRPGGAREAGPLQ
jgi:hypothetical protein